MKSVIFARIVCLAVCASGLGCCRSATEAVSVSAVRYDWLSRKPAPDVLRLAEGDASTVRNIVDNAERRGCTQVDVLPLASKHPQSLVLLFEAADGSVLDCWSVDTGAGFSLSQRKWPSMKHRGGMADVKEADRKRWYGLLGSVQQRLPR